MKRAFNPLKRKEKEEDQAQRMIEITTIKV